LMLVKRCKRAVLVLWWRPAMALSVLFLLALSSAKKRGLTAATTNEDDSSDSSSAYLDVAGAVALVKSGEPVDALLVLGGGPPVSARVTLPFVEKRVDAAWEVYDAAPTKPAILALSAGTAHAKQMLTPKGLPLWESTAAAAALVDRGVPPEHVFVETSSFDTISNAFFARTTHVDLQGWTRLVVITTDWHVPRTEAIFEWIFPSSGYDLHFLATDSAGLSAAAVDARRAKEATSLASVRGLRRQYPALTDVYTFLTTKHDFYTAAKLAAAADEGSASSSGDEAQQAVLLRESYGGSSSSPPPQRR